MPRFCFAEFGRWVGFAVFCAAFCSTAGATEKRHILVNVRLISQLVSIINAETNVALVRFQTDFYPTRKLQGKQITLPMTEFETQIDGRVLLQVRGEFSLVKNLSGMLPALGRVDETIQIKGPFFQRDESFKKLKPLFLISPKSEMSDNSIVVLAVLPKRNKSILESSLIGPLGKQDVMQIIDLSVILQKEPFEEMPQHRAEELLASENPWTANVALVRLDHLKKLSGRHFGIVIKTAPISTMDEIVDDFLTWTDPSRRKQTTAEIIKLLGAMRPEREKAFLNALNRVFRRNAHITYVDLSDLRSAAQQYRGKIENDSQRRNVVAEPPALIEFRSKEK
jgi:hypothetical protein